MTLVIAHRGFSRQFPENTMVAFEAAADAGAQMIELDVTLTTDGKLVCIHDDTLTRTTDGEGFVCHHSMEELRKLDAGQWFGGEPQPVPMLDEVLDAFVGRVDLNIEIKPFFPLSRSAEMQAALKALVAEITERQAEAQILLSSSNFFMLEFIRDIGPEIRIALIYRRPLTDYDPRYVCRKLRAWSLHPYYRQLGPDLLHELQEDGVKVFPYTIDERSLMRRMLDNGVDGMFTDSPDWLLEEIALRESEARRHD